MSKTALTESEIFFSRTTDLKNHLNLKLGAQILWGKKFRFVQIEGHALLLLLGNPLITFIKLFLQNHMATINPSWHFPLNEIQFVHIKRFVFFQGKVLTVIFCNIHASKECNNARRDNKIFQTRNNINNLSITCIQRKQIRQQNFISSFPVPKNFFVLAVSITKLSSIDQTQPLTVREWTKPQTKRTPSGQES